MTVIRISIIDKVPIMIMVRLMFSCRLNCGNWKLKKVVIQNFEDVTLSAFLNKNYILYIIIVLHFITSLY